MSNPLEGIFVQHMQLPPDGIKLDNEMFPYEIIVLININNKKQNILASAHHIGF